MEVPIRCLSLGAHGGNVRYPCEPLSLSKLVNVAATIAAHLKTGGSVEKWETFRATRRTRCAARPLHEGAADGGHPGHADAHVWTAKRDLCPTQVLPVPE